MNFILSITVILSNNSVSKKLIKHPLLELTENFEFIDMNIGGTIICNRLYNKIKTS